MNGHESSAGGSNPATSGTMSGNHVIFPMEAEAFVQELITFSISDIGSSKCDLLNIAFHELKQYLHKHDVICVSV